ncbi:MAG: aminopeptidase YwaD [Bacteroidia bacterium]|jgi:aminopeptidase YwaD
MKKFVAILFCYLLFANTSVAQDVVNAQYTIDTLCSPYFGGRGYVDFGDKRASAYIASQYETIGLQKLNTSSYYHRFKLNVNTFPTVVNITKNKIDLTPGRDFIVAPDCPTTIVQNLTVHMLDKALILDKKRFKKLLKLDWSKHVVLVDTMAVDKSTQKKYDKFLKKYKNPVLLKNHKKLTWSVGRNQNSKSHISFLPGVLSDLDQISLQIEAKMIHGHAARNVVGYIPGSEQSDSFIFITGHYDHLGKMGQKCVMPGANDNASGIAMMLDFASYYIQNPPRYSVVFVAFAAEEAGLVGSYFFVNELSSFVEPTRIRFVVNMDLMGSGQEGIMAVNGAILDKEYELLSSINETKKYLPQTKKRGKAANSDHYFFTESGIPAFFFYLMGPYNHYHDIDDTRENLTLEAKSYNGSFRLIRDFISALMSED